MKKIKLISLIFVAAASFLLSFSANAVATATAKYVYDANSRLTKVVYSGASDRTVSFTYDNNGNLIKVDASSTADPIVIETQPFCNAVWETNKLTLTVTASGSGLTYKWQKFIGGIWTDISGETASTFTIDSLATTDNGLYRCAITDGINTVYSDSVKVYVLKTGTPDLWESTTYLAPGSHFTIYNFEVPTLASSFTAKPKLLKGELVQPVKGLTVTYALTLFTSPTVLSPMETLDCMWPSAFLLYDKTKLTSFYASGFRCADFLASYPQYDEDTYVVIQTATGTAQYLNRFFTLVPPEISEVRDSGNSIITKANKGDTITIIGNYFGKKAPTAWLEYMVGGKAGISKLLLKVQTPLEYPDETKAGKSCMDLTSATGYSKIKVLIPATLPVGIYTGWPEDNNIVIDNGQGLATFPFNLK